MVIASTMATMMNLLNVFTRKQNASVDTVSNRPAAVGPIMRPAFCISAFMAMALGRSSFAVTISVVKVRRIGVSMALMMPRSNAIAMMCQISINQSEEHTSELQSRENLVC